MGLHCDTLTLKAPTRTRNAQERVKDMGLGGESGENERWGFGAPHHSRCGYG